MRHGGRHVGLPPGVLPQHAHQRHQPEGHPEDEEQPVQEAGARRLARPPLDHVARPVGRLARQFLAGVLHLPAGERAPALLGGERLVVPIVVVLVQQLARAEGPVALGLEVLGEQDRRRPE